MTIQTEETELWRDIPNFVGYQASNLGRLKALEKTSKSYNCDACIRKERILKGKPDRTGYISHCLKSPSKKKHWLSHRLIAFAWIPNPMNKPFINHINGIKTDNRIENLEWCTRVENGIHAVKTGLHTPLRGSINGNSKLKPEQVLAIRQERAGGMSEKEVANKYNIGCTTVGYIVKRKLWAHL